MGTGDAMAEREPARRVRLEFDAGAVAAAGTPLHRDLSAIAREGDTLFLACDEGAGIERLLRDGEGWGRHRRVRLGELIALPGGPEGEMDVEGLSVEDGWLWVVGSQAITRDKVKDGDSGAASLAELADTDWEENRQFLGRFPLVERHGGLWPVGEDGARRAAHLRFARKGRLRRWLRRDRHLAPFLGLPAKENGLDVEGIATRGDRVWVGLRGPVLGQSAVILEMELREAKGGRLKARRIEGRSRVRKHFVDTDGLGVRDMKWDGEDLMVVTGPVLSGDGPAAVLRLRGFARREGAGYVGEAARELAQRLPYHAGRDHPEALACLGGRDWLVIHDSPGEDRVGDDPPRVEADVWRL